VRCGNLNLLVVYYPDFDNFINRTTLFYSEGVDDIAPFVADGAGVTETAWMTLGKCLDMVFKGKILDVHTVSGLLAFAMT